MSENISAGNKVTRIAVMSPDRFWCQGIAAIIGQQPVSGVSLYICHSLSVLKNHLLQEAADVLLTEEYGDGENCADWLVFIYWKTQAFPAIPVVPLYHPVILTPNGKRQNRIHFNSLRIPCALQMTSSCSTLRTVLQSCLDGHLVAGPGAFRGSRLTFQERRVLKCLCHGASIKALSARLCLSCKTISAHTVSALRKLGLKRMSSLFIK